MARSTDRGASFRRWKRERNKAIRDLDLEYMRKEMPRASSDEVLLMALHKARYEAVEIEPALRHASRAWLEERGLSRYMSIPWPTDGSLPG